MMMVMKKMRRAATRTRRNELTKKGLRSAFCWVPLGYSGHAADVKACRKGGSIDTHKPLPSLGECTDPKINIECLMIS